MKYRYKLTYHLVGGETLVSEEVGEEKSDRYNMNLAMCALMDKKYAIEFVNDDSGIRGINMRNVLYVDLEIEEIL